MKDQEYLMNGFDFIATFQRVTLNALDGVNCEVVTQTILVKNQSNQCHSSETLLPTIRKPQTFYF